MKNRPFKTTTERFFDFHDMLETCDARGVNSWATSENRQHRSSWAGDTYKDARDYLIHGDDEAVETLKRGAKVAPIESIKPRIMAAPVGSTPIVPAAIIGLPNSMKRRVKVNAKARVITLVVNITYSANVDAEQVAEHGRALCSFVKAAEQAGYRVALDIMACFSEEEGGAAYVVRLNIKRAEQFLDIKRVTFPLIHASMFRQIFFDWYERYPNAEYISFYGTPLYLWKQARVNALLSGMLKPNEHYINLMDDINAADILAAK